MKFGKNLKYQMVQEWKPKYVRYDFLKRLIKMMTLPRRDDEKELIVKLPNGEFLVAEDVTQELFLKEVYADVEMVSAFYMENMQSFEGCLVQLTSLAMEEESQGRSRRPGSSRFSLAMGRKKPENLEEAFLQLFRGLLILQNYAEVNTQGFLKVMKKFDKKTQSKMKEEFAQNKLFKQPFVKHEDLNRVRKNIKTQFAKLFTKNDRGEASRRLYARRHSHMDLDMLKVGINIGITCALLILIVMMLTPIIHTKSFEYSMDNANSVLPVFRVCQTPGMALWLWGVDVLAWHLKRVNHIFILQLDPVTTMTYQQIFKLAGLLTAVNLTCFVLFIGRLNGSFDIGITFVAFPLANIVSLLVWAAWPFHMFHRSSRWSMLKALWNLLITPFGEPTVSSFYLADILTSLVIPFGDIKYVVMYYTSRAWLTLDHEWGRKLDNYFDSVFAFIPLGWRLYQCFFQYKETRDTSHVWAAGKYCSAVLLTAFCMVCRNVSFMDSWYMQTIWVVLVVIFTLWNYFVDIVFDWGLVTWDHNGVSLLKDLVYPRWVYVAAAVLDLPLSLIFSQNFASSVVVGFQVFPYREYADTAYLTLEIIRRFGWLLLKVAHDHRAACANFRAMDYIQVQTAPSEGAPKRQLYHAGYVSTSRKSSAPIQGYMDVNKWGEGEGGE